VIGIDGSHYSMLSKSDHRPCSYSAYQASARYS
jgi:hypothetical protein